MKIFIVFGTRPEAIKMIPVIKELKKRNFAQIEICITSQHTFMLQQVLSLFDIQCDYDLNIMKYDQTITETLTSALSGLNELFQKHKPNRVLVHGDTTTTFAGALAAFYNHIPVGHVEAGIRSHNIYSPWPEEINRKLAGTIADLHFAPTFHTAKNLLLEGVKESHIYITGNTVVDILLETKKIIAKRRMKKQLDEKFSYLDPRKKLLLITVHRREIFGKSFAAICKALAAIAKFNDVQLIFPVHLNPHVQAPVKKYLSNIKNIFLIEPQDYFSMLYLMQRCYVVLTDSGGIQEEAPAFNKPLIVMREITERVEGLSAGVAKLVGVRKEGIVKATQEILEDRKIYEAMARVSNPYGDGKAAQRIADVIVNSHNMGFLNQF
ncbi:UDP-N-acetylglucosamine 2-epimerase [Legionella beliardensis]|uniref:UDP-N-acetylglucosamine 2-epimerase (non-hydrolyzing) n=1 Tax=Legionella beliardensis TaxID=91822 RepID=A0A378I0L2_9GAMM|nr:UDP-N-acetylglucosamine 2-epimerase (non-hydrolyzing) [Legionella beliardensis]STX28205.1 UDP-N-acetylglucosamine 2-epimerase [Legionella beliardensis]